MNVDLQADLTKAEARLDRVRALVWEWESFGDFEMNVQDAIKEFRQALDGEDQE